MLHVVGIVVVAQLPVIPELDAEIVGFGISSAVVMQGPKGQNVSKDLPSQLPAFQVRRPSPRAETSIMPV